MSQKAKAMIQDLENYCRVRPKTQFFLTMLKAKHKSYQEVMEFSFTSGFSMKLYENHYELSLSMSDLKALINFLEASGIDLEDF